MSRVLALYATLSLCLFGQLLEPIVSGAKPIALTPAIASFQALEASYSNAKVTETDAVAYHRLRYFIAVPLSNQQITLTADVRAAERTWIGLRIGGNEWSTGAWFDVGNGAVGTVNSGAAATITDLGGGVWRCRVTATFGTITAPNVQLWLTTGDNSTTYDGTVGNGLYLYTLSAYRGGSSPPLPDFTFYFIPDPHLNGNPATWNTLTNWVAANVPVDNAQAVLSSGDYSSNGALADLQSAWTNGDPVRGWAQIDALGVPWASAVGNHDYDNDSPPGRSTINFDAEVGYSRISAKPWFESFYDDGANSKANYALRFIAGGRNFLVIVLELFPRAAAAAWAAGVIDAYPDHSVVLLTHGYQKNDGTRCVSADLYCDDTYNLSAGYSGEELWQNLLKLKPNVRITLSGHYIPGPPYANYLASVGDNGNTVHQIFANRQSATVVLKLRFSPATQQVYITDVDPATGNAKGDVTPYAFALVAP
jgi:hypothetical protein